jgi:hypothetical protein
MKFNHLWDWIENNIDLVIHPFIDLFSTVPIKSTPIQHIPPPIKEKPNQIKPMATYPNPINTCNPGIFYDEYAKNYSTQTISNQAQAIGTQTIGGYFNTYSTADYYYRGATTTLKPRDYYSDYYKLDDIPDKHSTEYYELLKPVAAQQTDKAAIQTAQQKANLYRQRNLQVEALLEEALKVLETMPEKTKKLQGLIERSHQALIEEEEKES